MAEKNNYYGSGIFVAGNIDIGAIGKPADSRVMVPNLNGLAELVADKRVYDGMIVYCESTKTYHKCSVEWDSSMNITSSSWKQVEIQSLDELKALIAQESTAAMEFKGTIKDGVLPTLEEGKNYDGNLYKVATKNVTVPAALNAEGEVEVVAKPGDSLVCEGGKWYLIPSGDDIENTWRAIKVNGVEKLGGGITTGDVDFVQGDNVTITEAAGVITIAAQDTHYASKLVAANSATDAEDETAEAGQVHLNLVENGEVKSSHKLVGAGGITVTHTKAEGEDGENVIIIEAPEGAKYDLTAKTENNEAILSLAGTDNTEDKVAIVGDDAVSVTVDGGKIKVSAHDTKYTGSEGSEIKVGATNDGAITAELTEAVRTKLNKAWEEVGVAAGLVEGLAEGQVKANKEAIEAINDETNGILAKANAEIAKDRERLVALEAIDHDYAGADATLKAELQKEIDDDVKVVSDYVGTFTHGTAKTVVEYVDEKTKGIATEGAMTALNERVTAAEGDIKTIKADYLKAEDIADFETKENVQKVADDLAAEVKARDDADKAFETRIAALEDNFGDGEGTVEAQIAAAVGAEKARAEEIEGGLRTDVNAIKDDYLKAADRTALQTAINNEKARAEGIEGGLRTDVDAVTGRVTTAEGKITALEEASAKHAEKTYVDTELGKKADKSVVAAMYTNAQIDTAIEQAIGDRTDYTNKEIDDKIEVVLGKSNDPATANTVYGAKAAAAAAQNDATIAKTKIETFLGTITPDGSQNIIDTLAEINNYVTSDTEAFATLSGKVTNIENGTTHTVAKSLDDDAVAQVKAVKVDKAVDAEKLGGELPSYYATAASVTDITKENGFVDGKIAGKADKVTGAVAGNFAGLDANGNLTDSGISAANLWDKQENLVNFNDTWSVNEDGVISSSEAGEIFIGDVANHTLLGANGLIVTGDDGAKVTCYQTDGLYKTGQAEGWEGTLLLPDGSGTLAVETDELNAIRDSVQAYDDRSDIAENNWAFSNELRVGALGNAIRLSNTEKGIILDNGNENTKYLYDKIVYNHGDEKTGELTLPYKTGTIVVDSDLDAYALKSNYGANTSELILKTPADSASVRIKDGYINFVGDAQVLDITNGSSAGTNKLSIGNDGLAYSFTANSGTSIATEHVAFVSRIQVGTGLKAETVTNATDGVKERHISIDEEVVFVLDCN